MCRLNVRVSPESVATCRTVVFAAFHSDYRVANAEVAEIVAANPALIGFACVHARAGSTSWSAGRCGTGVSLVSKCTGTRCR
jgi:hypothetical protein